MELSEQSYKALLKKLKNKGGLRQISCECCLKDVTSTTYIKCSTCVNIFLCINCYCLGRSKGEHENSHPYQVIDPLRFPLFVSDWSAKEELLLFEGMLKYGYGNWSSIAQHIGTSKSLRDCEKHYKQVYLGKSSEELSNLQILSRQEEDGSIVIEETENEFMNIEVDQPPEDPKPVLIEKHPLAEFAGYMPLRQDFEVEYENDIEMYLADLEFYEDDRPEDVHIKLRQLQVYNKVLDEREERKDFAINRWPEEIRNERRFKKNPIHKAIYTAMKPYARFLAADKFLKLCEGMIKEYELKLKLEELLEAQKNGVKTEEEFREFVANKKNNMKPQDYDSILKESAFVFKETEKDRESLVAQAEEMPEEDLEDKFCIEIGIDKEKFLSLKDQISQQFELKTALKPEDLEVEAEPEVKQQIYDFIVKMKEDVNCLKS